MKCFKKLKSIFFWLQNLTLTSVKTGSLDVKCGWLGFSDDVTKIEKVCFAFYLYTTCTFSKTLYIIPLTFLPTVYLSIFLFQL